MDGEHAITATVDSAATEVLRTGSVVTLVIRPDFWLPSHSIGCLSQRCARFAVASEYGTQELNQWFVTSPWASLQPSPAPSPKPGSRHLDHRGRIELLIGCRGVLDDSDGLVGGFGDYGPRRDALARVTLDEGEALVDEVAVATDGDGNS